MKIALPIIAIAALSGVASLYAPKVQAHLACGVLYNECIMDGGSVSECQYKENYCWVYNQWPGGLPERSAIKENHR